MDWKTPLLGDESWSFLLETIFRTFIMFTVILLSLRLLGKRGIKQLSVFELGVIIGLGSAAGDPMFYKDVGLLPCMIIILLVVSFYRFVTLLINRNHHFERFVEGKPTCIVQEGHFVVANFKKEPIAHDELFAQLRLHSVAHLGQVQKAIVETNGELSVFYYPDTEVKYGLPIIPGMAVEKWKKITREDYYACSECGNTQKLSSASVHTCSECGKEEWIKAINSKRIR